MRFKAIIFDLFGTLVENFTKREYNKVYQMMVDELGAPHDAFVNAFGHSYSDRCKGKYVDIEENLAAACHEIGHQPSDRQIQTAAQYRYDFTIRTLKPKTTVLAALTTLRTSGYQLGLITDCGPDVPLYWHSTPLANLIDVPVFSCSEQVKKPDPEIYRRCLQRLNRNAGECVYVGDGGSQELTGAKAAGCLPILKRINLSEIYDARPELVNWDGIAVDEICELPQLLSGLESGVQGG
jgi:putative hydrolase of the HAD superfamily